MDASVFAKIVSDKSICDLKKIKYKYSDVDMKELTELMKISVFKTLPIQDFRGNDLVYMPGIIKLNTAAFKSLLISHGDYDFGLKAMEDEISSSFSIESIDFSRDSVRKILKGYAPEDESENRIYGMKKGLEFISDLNNEISEDNIHSLYELAIGQYLDEDNKLIPGHYYRHDTVYVMGQKLEHTGLAHSKLPEYMSRLVEFINAESELDDLSKAAAIHFYMAYLHPWFDGNGRMARLMHLWYLRRRGWSAVMFIAFSSYIERSRNAYYKAFTLCESNENISGVLDVSPFLNYFSENVYNKLKVSSGSAASSKLYTDALAEGKITEKEKDLWGFVLSAYGNSEFSTKQLEKDFNDAAYATIRSFVLKFKDLGLLFEASYGNRKKYSVKY